LRASVRFHVGGHSDAHIQGDLTALRELANSGTLTLLTATKHAEISEAAVLADLIRG
jgi:uncharacterized protein YeaO (DUF488 family)